jgi:hypothetical protein
MATVYTVEIQKLSDSLKVAEITIIDDKGIELDKWFSEPSGHELGYSGKGVWRQLASVKTIAVMDPHASKAFAALKYTTFPWKAGSTGQLELAFPFKDSDGKLEYKYHVKSVS